MMKAKIAKAKKRAKKGFTLVELVIVIAILAILASIAIPVVSTTINSARISTMKSDTATMNMLIKECISSSQHFLNTVKYNGKSCYDATINDVCKQGDVGQRGSYLATDDTFFKREIGGSMYEMVFTTKNNVELNGGDISVDNIKYVITSSLKVKDLDPR